MDGLAVGEPDFEVQPLYGDGLGPGALEVHLDAPGLRVPDCAVAEPLEVEPPPEVAVDALQDVPVEACRHPLAVVVGGFEHGPVLAQVDPGEKAVSRGHGGAHPGDEVGGFRPLEVADVRTQPQDQPRFPGVLPEEFQPVPVLPGDGENFQVLELPGQRGRAFLQGGPRDVDGNETQASLALDQGPDQQPRLDRRAAAELDESDAAGEKGGDLSGPLRQDGVLRPGQVVLGEAADLLEQLRAGLVVEVAAGQPLR